MRIRDPGWRQFGSGTVRYLTGGGVLSQLGQPHSPLAHWTLAVPAHLAFAAPARPAVAVPARPAVAVPARRVIAVPARRALAVPARCVLAVPARPAPGVLALRPSYWR
jgi:hypothetical protein